jgi:hypothetical protein
MEKEELGQQYLRKAQMIREKMEYLEEELRRGGRRISRDSQYELKRRIHLLFDMYLDCSTVGRRLLVLAGREKEEKGD